jgi:hypothetical protein
MGFGWAGEKHVGAVAMALALALAALGLVLVGCGDFPFQIKEGQQAIGVATDVVPRTSPETVLANVAICIGEQRAGEYVEQLASSFVFVADQIDVATLGQAYPGVDIFSDWTLSVETRVTEYMLDAGRCTLAGLDFTNETMLDQPTDTTYSTQVDYAGILYLNGHAQSFSGEARLYMKKDTNSLWSINRWEDIRPQGSTEDTWGMLRGRIRATM